MTNQIKNKPVKAAPFDVIMKTRESGNWLPGTGSNRRPSD
jgi:hypothetical protein